MDLRREQRHRGDQDQLAHDNPRHLVNPSYPIRVPQRLAREAVDTDLDQSGPAGQAIDQAEKLTPHDRTPLLIIGRGCRPRAFPAFFAARGKWLRPGMARCRRNIPEEVASREREAVHRWPGFR